LFTHLRLRRFKAYRDSGDVALRPLTLVLGANNSGKSSLLHAILLLAQTLDDTTSRQPLVTSGAFVDLGGYYDIVWGGQGTKAGPFSIELSAEGRGLERSMSYLGSESDQGPPADLRVAFSFDARRNSTMVSSCAVEGGGHTFLAARRAGRGYVAPNLSASAREHLTIGFRHFLPVYRPRPKFDFTKHRDVMNTYLRSDMAATAWSRLFAGVGHVAPLRQPVPRYGILGKSPTSELGPGGENLLRALRSYDDDGGQPERRLVADVNRWISENFGMLDELRLVNVDEAGTVLALIGDEREGFRNINVANMGEGISQLLPIIARVLTTPSDGALLVEQPELHLHPAAQADLADLFISGARAGNRQYIVETHSEHMLLRLRRRIAEKRISPDRVAVLYVERGAKSSAVRSLDLNREGEFHDWPEGFFDERYREALAIMEATRDA
jgi:predicted ATPase